MTKTITISGKPFVVPIRYKVGDTLDTEGEANALNQTFHEAVRNNLASKFEDEEDKLTQAVVDEYVQSYEFGVRSGGGRVGDPTEREAIRLASERIKDAIRGNGSLKLADYKQAAITELAKKLLDKEPSIRVAAAENVARQQSVAAATLTDLGLIPATA